MNTGTDYTAVTSEAWRQLRPAEDMTCFDITTRIQRFAALLRVRLDDAVSAHGFSVYGDYAVAALVRRSETDVRPSSIAKDLLVTRAGITGRLDRLHESGYITRKPATADARNVFVRLTALGTRRVDAAFDAMQRERSRALDSLDPSGKEQLAELLRQALIGLEPT